MDQWSEFASLLQQPKGTLFLAEHMLCVRDRSGLLKPLRANVAQRRYEARRDAENIVLKARQMGMSTWIAGRFLLKTLFIPGTTTLMVANTQESAEALFAMVQRMWENLPTPLQSGIGKRGRANARQMTFPAMDSEFRVASAGEPNAGRGLSVTNLHCSEMARWQGDSSETLAGLRAALAPGGELVLESTPNGAYGCFYEQWQQAETSGMVRHFFPWWYEPAYVGARVADFTEEEEVLVQREGLTAEQVGFRRELARRFGAMRVQEFAEDAVSCFRESGDCFFDRDALAACAKDMNAPMDVRRNGALQVWLPAVPGRRYIAAVDVAGGGSGGDYSAVQVVDIATGMQCAELQMKMSPRDLAKAAAEIAHEYNGAMLVVERNNHGAAVLAYLEQERGANVFVDRDGLPGWLTDVASRPRMLSALAVLLSSSRSLFQGERLLAEMRSFVVDERGRPAAAVGCHDDLVMSMAIAQAVRARIA
ncbi:terminase [Terriglobus sp. TAA 43]|uniref:terminase n=1 Tax=Terriglobus sp. TAA 43 TaxID=278961 RepID=UPI0006471930|nr:terminase [Terriglobus sp. TAA 43]